MILTVVACSKDHDPTARISVNGTVLVGDVSDFNGDIDTSFTGNGGSLTRSFVWNNNRSTADITATAQGTFRMVVEDSAREVVLERSLNGAFDLDSFSGVTSAGVTGIWTVTITVTDFNGNGSFSLSEGN